MATYTPNYNFKKPDATDPFGDFRQDYNDNLDIIDQNLGGGGGGGDTVTWTQIQSSGTKIAEIDINGTPQEVYAPSGGGGGGSIDYSTTEQTIGTWINGKPLYQITVQTTTGNSTNTENTIWNFSGIHLVNICQVRAEWDTDSYIFVNCQDDIYLYSYPNRMVEVHHSNDYNSANIIFTVQYTKDTD